MARSYYNDRATCQLCEHDKQRATTAGFVLGLAIGTAAAMLLGWVL